MAPAIVPFFVVTPGNCTIRSHVSAPYVLVAITRMVSLTGMVRVTWIVSFAHVPPETEVAPVMGNSITAVGMSSSVRSIGPGGQVMTGGSCAQTT